MGRKRILIIASDADGYEPLPQIEREIKGVKGHHDCTILDRDVTKQEIEDVVLPGRFDILWWIAHAKEGELLIGHERVDGRDVAGFMRMAHARLCYISTCNSAPLPSLVRAVANVHVMAGEAEELRDDRAVSVARQYAHYLARGYGYRAAYDKIAPRDYAFLTPNGSLESLYSYFWLVVLWASITTMIALFAFLW